MQFQWPAMLWLLLLVPALVVAYILAQRRRQRYALRYASLSLVKEALGRGPGWRRHAPPALFLLSLIVMLLALARPASLVTLPSQEGTVILTMDASGSMRADDLKPSRLDAAKSAALAFIEKQPQGVKIGVVSFSDSAFLVQAPTSEKEEVVAAVNRLTTQRGTAIGSALLTSLEAIFEDAEIEGGAPISSTVPTPTPTPLPKGVYEPAIIVLLSDGESNRGPRPLDVVEQVAARGIRVYTIGVGSVAGVVLRNQGRSMRVRLDEATLKAVATATDGEYFNASTEKDLHSIYENLSTHLVFKKQQTEITALFTGAAVVLLLIAGTLSLLWFNRLP
ncbi:MAG: VWA domain-containing protein [Chloroflexi bacterium]|nr:VWA domain-containing protein [Chloroflexota bacterium]